MWLIFENLRGFVTTRPPLVMFMSCLGLFAVALLTMAYIVKCNELRNPDQKDWNAFLDGFKTVQFCVLRNDMTNVSDSIDPLGSQGIQDVISDVHDKIKGDHTDLPTTTVKMNPDEIVTVQLPLLVEIQPTLDFVNNTNNVSHLTTNMTGSQLGFEGSNAKTEFNVTFILPYQWNTLTCTSDGTCPVVKIQTCVSVQAPAKLFPRSRRPVCERENSTNGIENHLKIVTKKKTSLSPVSLLCDKMTSFTVQHADDPMLNIMLTLQDRSAINLHLMHTSYFLFVMVIMLLCYGTIRGRPSIKVKTVQFTELPSDA